jgi:hypothetical protein
MGVDVNVIDVLIGAVLMPPVIAVVNQAHWARAVKALIAVAACLIAAVITLWLRGPIDFHDWRNTAVVVVGSALAGYRLWWQPSGIAPAIEAATTANGAPAGTDTTAG